MQMVDPDQIHAVALAECTQNVGCVLAVGQHRSGRLAVHAPLLPPGQQGFCRKEPFQGTQRLGGIRRSGVRIPLHGCCYLVLLGYARFQNQIRKCDPVTEIRDHRIVHPIHLHTFGQWIKQ